MSSAAVIIARLAREDRLAAVLQTQAGSGPLGPATVQRLRRDVGPEAARWLMEFLAVQRKAVDKFGVGVWMATERAVQQASDRATAGYKAARFPVAANIYDVCCGAGGDSLALRQYGAVVAVDSDPAMTTMVAANLAQRPSAYPAAALCVDAQQLTMSGTANYLHIDPDRRPGEQRTIKPENYQPGLDVVQRLIESAQGAAVKWAPAAPLPPDWQGRCQREWISHRGSVRQQVAWFGELVSAAGTAARVATRVAADGTAQSFASEELRATVDATKDVGQWIVDLDGAVRAAGLSAAFGQANELLAVGDVSGFFTTDRFPEHPLASGYRVLWSGPADLKQIKRAAVGLGVRLLEIKVRGTEHRPEQLRGRLADKKTRGGPPATLLLGHHGGGGYAVIAQRGAVDDRRGGADGE
ncbi:THUMP-like domain-containing protein [Roseimaritima ulvae]|uniref:THUMP-like domain-containing protein n=1 Tax=Roseimaritima ulvae TaxID=980254 RepID=A0A5B9QN08_9BACT|nr:class I SAM-dependent methyltransferase [Roseimaritima ulvae]QEG38865.1 hypothetical protein UC8_08230 [Roseimaritima ulvae]